MGSVYNYCVVEDCTSAATITGNTNGQVFLYCGGIVGANLGTVRRFLADGVTVPVIHHDSYGSCYGAIVGKNMSNSSTTGTASSNCYHNCTDSYGNTTGIGICGSDQSGVAEPAYFVSSIPTGATVSPDAIVTYAGRYYYPSGTTVTITPAADTAFKTFSVSGATSSSLAADKLSATLTVGTQDVNVSVTLQAIGGSCGYNGGTDATWSLAQDGNGNYTRLTISGTGAMQDYDHDNNSIWRTTAPWGYGITSVTISDGITTIGKFAFCGCQQLSSITIGNSVKSIGDASINHCDALTELTLPASVASIGNGAFHNDVGLTRLNTQRTDGLVTLAENTIFNNCTALQAIVVPTPALAVQYQSATYWSTHAAKLRVPFGSQLFAATNEGGTAAYVIANATDWNNLATAVNGGANGSGQTFRQTANITVSNFTPIGNSEANSFRGTYDGGSKTLTATCNAVSSNYVAPFGYLYGTAAAHASVKDLSVVTTITAAGYKHIAGLIVLLSGYVDVTNCNAQVTLSATKSSQQTDLYPAGLISQASSDSGGTLTVTGCTTTGTISTDGKYAAGLVAIVQGTASISDCVSSVTIDSSTSGDGTHGGIIGSNIGATNIYGTVFNGRLLGTATSNVGGFIGWRQGGANIYNNLFIPAKVTVKTDNSATFARNDVDTHNCYYTYYLCDGEHYVPYYATDGITRRNGHATRTVTAGEYVTVSGIALTGTTTAYATSGITVYSGGGLSYGNNIYYGSGDNIAFTLNHADRTSYIFIDYSASAGALNGNDTDGYTLTMPDEDATINANYEFIRFAQGIFGYKCTSETEAKITICNSSATNIDIPATVTYNNITYNVTAIDADAFSQCTSLKNIFIEATTPPALGAGAFNACTDLAVIGVPAGTEETYKAATGWRDYASNIKTADGTYGNDVYWSYNSNSKTLTIFGTGDMATSAGNDQPWKSYLKDITTVEISNGVTNIGECAFDDCTALTSINIPTSVTSIGQYAFGVCNSLASIDIPANVTSIGDDAFNRCKSLTTITIPASVTTIGDNAFLFCTALTMVMVQHGESTLTELGNEAFSQCNALAVIYVPNGKVDDYKAAPNWTDYAEKMQGYGTCGDNVYWSYNSDSKALTIFGTGAMTTAPWGALLDEVKTVDIREGVTSIGNVAFSDFTSLTSVTIPASVTSIHDEAFSYCPGLESISVAAGNTTYDSRNDCNAIIETNTNTLILGCKSTVIPNTLKSAT